MAERRKLSKAEWDAAAADHVRALLESLERYDLKYQRGFKLALVHQSPFGNTTTITSTTHFLRNLLPEPPADP